MTLKIDIALETFEEAKRKGVTYSMRGSRDGSDGTADCSGMVYRALRNAGASNAGWILNTDSMHAWLKKNGYELVAENKQISMQKGDVWIWGKAGSSGGSAGHTGIMRDSTYAYHCTGYWNRVAIEGYSDIIRRSGFPYSYVYRQKGTTPTTTAPKPSTPTPSDNTIKTVQKWLNSSYNSKLTVDGSFGPASKKAVIKAVQTQMNKSYKAKLVIDGSFGPASKKEWRALKKGSTGNLVKLAQGMLIGKGYNPSGFDGSFGPGMDSAVRSFQKANRLAADGSLGPATASALFK